MVRRLATGALALAVALGMAVAPSSAAARGYKRRVLSDDESEPGNKKRAVDEALEEKKYDLDEYEDGGSGGGDDDDGGDSSDSGPPAELSGAARNAAPLLPAEGQFVLWGILEVALNARRTVGATSVGGVFRPTALAPDAWYGFRDDISFGVVHSDHGQTGFWGAQGEGLCFSGSSSGCSAFYSRLGALVRWRFYREGAFELAADGGLLVRATDPFALALKAGVVGRYVIAPDLYIEGAPNLLLGISNRTVQNVTLNQELLSLPVAIHWAASDSVMVFGQTGFSAFIEDLGDTMRIPLSVGASYQFTEALAAGAVLSLPALIGGDQLLFDGFRGRTLTLTLLYRL